MTTKTKNKLKDSLKSEVKEELEIQKEKKREENRKLNANLREVILYTKETCTYCKNFKNALEDEGIKYIEKEISQEGISEEFNKITTLTGIGVFPTIFTNDNWIIPNRDFKGIPQGIQLIKAIAQPIYENPPFEERMIEMIKTLNGNMQQAFQNMNYTLQPIQKFIRDIQKEIEEENEQEKRKE
tara:strand:+ start:29 stop:580 length:552 start_codon:yes stop_codon:yes gene_type:complete